MGEVWRAKDTKLGREVAIKLLPPETTRAETAKRRFLHMEPASFTAISNLPTLCVGIASVRAQQYSIVNEPPSRRATLQTDSQELPATLG